jgi:hypothetical protein
MIWIWGSLRRGSQIQSSSVHPAQLMLLIANAQLQVETIRDIPLYGGDSEVLRASRKPLKEAIAGRHGLVLATPDTTIRQAPARSSIQLSGERRRLPLANQTSALLGPWWHATGCGRSAATTPQGSASARSSARAAQPADRQQSIGGC